MQSTPLKVLSKLAPGVGVLAAFVGVAAVLASCGGFNPVHDGDVNDLGPETGNADAYHRAGQPCVVCHGPDGPAKLQFTIAGTVFTSPTADKNGTFTGACGGQVLLVDSLGNTPIDPATGKANQPVPVNCVGNFFTTSDGSNGTLIFTPAFPVKVEVTLAGSPAPIPMLGPINREPSCGKCHQDPSSVSSPGVVFSGAGTPPASCSPQTCTEGTGAQQPIIPGGPLQ